MKKFIQVAIIASTGLMFIQTSANAQAWKHCAQNVVDTYLQCKNRGGGKSCDKEIDRGWDFCSKQYGSNTSGAFQDQPITFREFYNWVAGRYGGQTTTDEVR